MIPCTKNRLTRMSGEDLYDFQLRFERHQLTLVPSGAVPAPRYVEDVGRLLADLTWTRQSLANLADRCRLASDRAKERSLDYTTDLELRGRLLGQAEAWAEACRVVQRLVGDRETQRLARVTVDDTPTKTTAVR